MITTWVVYYNTDLTYYVCVDIITQIENINGFLDILDEDFQVFSVVYIPGMSMVVVQCRIR